MQRVQIWLLVMISLLVLSFNARAEDQKKVIEQVMTASHYDQHLQSITNFALAELDLRKDVINIADYKSLRNILADSYKVEKLQSDLTGMLQKHYDEKRFQQWLSQLQSPLFKKMIQLEERASTDAAFEGMMAYAQTLDKQPPSTEREALIKRLDKATSGTDLALKGQLSVLRAFLTAINPTLPENKQLNPVAMEHILSSTRSQLEPLLQEIALLTHLYTYRSISDKELEEYIKIYESNLGVWFSELHQRAVSNALSTAATRATTQIVQHLEIKQAI